MIFITFQVGVKWVKIITFFPCLEMIFKQYYTITIFHVYYPPSLPRVSQASLSSHECLVKPTCHAVRPPHHMVQLTCHLVLLTCCMVRPLQPPLQLRLHSQQILKFFKVFSAFLQAKTNFFSKTAQKMFQYPKKQKIF